MLVEKNQMSKTFQTENKDFKTRLILISKNFPGKYRVVFVKKIIWDALKDRSKNGMEKSKSENMFA